MVGPGLAQSKKKKEKKNIFGPIPTQHSFGLMLAQRLWADLNSISSGRTWSIKDGINPYIWANPSQYILI
jgi:hypothetical protein